MKINETEIELMDDLPLTILTGIVDGSPVCILRLIRKFKHSPPSGFSQLLGSQPEEEENYQIIYQKTVKSRAGMREVIPELTDSLCYASLVISRFINDNEASGIC